MTESDHPQDGVICQSAWDRAPIKVFHLLKEKTRELDAETSLGELWVNELRNNVRDGIGYKLAMRTIEIWSAWAPEICAFTGTDADIKPEEVAGLLEATAVANFIKHTTGKSTSNRRLEDSTETEWKEQIKEARPDVVLCGGLELFNVVWRRYSEGLESRKRPRRHDPERRNWGLAYGEVSENMEYFLYDGCIYLQFYHPSYYGKTQVCQLKTLYKSATALREVRSSKKIGSSGSGVGYKEHN